MTRLEALVCWKCGSSIDGLPLPLGRRAECEACRADLHVCRMCRFYDTSVAKSCREPIAEQVTDKERANFCDYFQVLPGAYVPPDNARAEQARAQLEELFGEGPQRDTTGDDRGVVTPSSADEAREKLERLFGLDGEKEG